MPYLTSVTELFIVKKRSNLTNKLIVAGMKIDKRFIGSYFFFTDVSGELASSIFRVVEELCFLFVNQLPEDGCY